MPAGSAIFLASDTTVFRARYGTAPFGQFTRNLSNADQQLLLLDAFGNEIDLVHYDDDDPWPDADGNGSSLQLISVNLDNSLASSWRAVVDNTSGTVAPEPDRAVQVYPNPTTGRVQISAVHLITTIDITDLQGRTLATFEVNANDFSLDMAHLADGMYFMRVMGEGGIWFGNVVKD